LQEVADTLRALETDARLLRAQVVAEQSAADSLAIAQKQFQVGGISYVSVLNAQRLFLQARQGRVQAQAARLFRLGGIVPGAGGGWWNRQGEEV